MAANPVEPDLALHQSPPDLLRNILRNLVEPDPAPAPKPPRPSPEPSEPSPEPCWTWPGACTSAHRSYSGLKTPLAYAVGEKNQRRERVRRKKMQVREKVGKSRNIVFFQWFVAPEGRKVGSLKRRVRSQLVRWEMKNCTPLWREARFPSENAQSTSAPEHF